LSGTINIAAGIQQKAFELGFSACGFAPAAYLQKLEPVFRDWLSKGNAGEMSYLNRNVEVRLDPRKLVEGAKTVIVLAAGYYSNLPVPAPGTPRISRYALGEDYHKVLKSSGRQLLEWIRRETGPVNGRIFTDSAPVFEREWAVQAGIGWIGKNGCLILPGKGSWFFLAELIIDLEIPCETEEVTGRCGTCTRCIEACPTRALNGDGSIDPRKCISYLTIEQQDEIPEEFIGQWKDWIFGCDICQDVCPWNKKAEVTPITRFLPKPGLSDLSDTTIKGLDVNTFAHLFDGTPVLRAGWSGIIRNFEFLEKDKS
jgi:epoxyqueuosine reductase